MEEEGDFPGPLVASRKVRANPPALSQNVLGTERLCPFSATFFRSDRKVNGRRALLRLRARARKYNVRSCALLGAHQSCHPNCHPTARHELIRARMNRAAQFVKRR
jgi:hypothetical protein